MNGGCVRVSIVETDSSERAIWILRIPMWSKDRSGWLAELPNSCRCACKGFQHLHWLHQHKSGLSAMCELEHDAAKGRSESRRDCSFQRPLPRRRLHRSTKFSATAKECCVSNSRTCNRLVCPHSDHKQ